MRTDEWRSAFGPHKLCADAWRPAAVLCLLALAHTLSSAMLLSSQDPAKKMDSKAAASALSQARTAAPTAGPGSSPNVGNIRLRVEVVNVPVSVLDKRGLPVIDLTKDDFEVYEDGRFQTIKFFGHEPPLPLKIGLILDTSNSARPQLQFEKDAASEFAYNMLQGRSSKNQVFLQTYDATSSLIQDFTNDADLLNEKIRGLKAGGGKALYDAIYTACREKLLQAGNPENTRRVLVLVSDGRDVQSTHTLDEAISMAHKAQTAIYVIGNAAYGYSNPADRVLARIAEDTGGASFFPQRASPGADLGTGYLSHGQIGETSQNKGLGAETGIYSAQRMIQLADSLQAIGRELNDQYYLAYTPTNPTLDGTYRSIHVVAHRKGVQVRNKPGYFATVEQ